MLQGVAPAAIADALAAIADAPAEELLPLQAGVSRTVVCLGLNRQIEERPSLYWNDVVLWHWCGSRFGDQGVFKTVKA